MHAGTQTLADNIKDLTTKPSRKPWKEAGRQRLSTRPILRSGCGQVSVKQVDGMCAHQTA